MACTPRPATARTSVADAMPKLSACAARVTAHAKGCSLPACTAAHQASKSARVVCHGKAAINCGRPTVSVPVLSNATTLTPCATSSASASLIKMPRFAAAPVPTMIAVGVARPSAQGQAITSTATAFKMARSQSPLIATQPSKVTSAITMTTGTNTALTRSTKR